MPKRKVVEESDSDPKRDGKRARTSKSSASSETSKMDSVDNMPGADVQYIPDFVDVSTAQEWYLALEALDTWYHPRLKVYGREVKQSRSIAAYSTDESLQVRYSGHQVEIHTAYPPILRTISNSVEHALDEKFNHIMLNQYASGDEYIGKHRDTKQNKVIASLSLGAERTFIFAPDKKISGKSGAHIRRITLKSGSLLIMKGDTQENWKHEIPKEPKIKEGRISLTFRQI